MSDGIIRAVPARVVAGRRHGNDDELMAVETALRHLTGLRFALERLRLRLTNGRGSLEEQPPSPQNEE